MFHPTILDGAIVQEKRYFSWGAKGIPNNILANS
jgi:hypothetical protein